MNPQLQSMIGQAVQAFQVGNHARAETILQKILQLHPNNLPAIHILGLIKASEAKHSEAAQLLSKAVKLEPNDPSLRYNLAKALAASGMDIQSLPHHEKAATLTPKNPEVWLNYAKSLANLSRHEEALEKIHIALDIQPEYLEALISKSAILNELNHFDDSLATSDLALGVNPLAQDAWSNRGGALKGLGRFHDALDAYDRAISIDGNYSQAWFNRGVLLKDLKYFEEAIASYDKAIDLNLNDGDSHWNRALLQLNKGNFIEGFRGFEWRWKRANAESYRHKEIPTLQNAQDIGGKKILVWAEQGLGDTIQFCRYISLLEERGVKVLFEVQASLVSVMANSFPSVEVVALGQKIEGIELQVPVASLPMLFETTLSTIPKHSPYLKIPSSKKEDWKNKLLSQNGKLNIGIACSGNFNFDKTDGNRRPIPLEKFNQLAPLANLFLVQKDLRALDETYVKQHPEIQYLGEAMQDFEDTGGIVENMDLVIAIDTSLAHFSAALAKETWVLLPSVADWRWLENQEETPWYSNIKLYRQQSPGDWDEVIQRVKNDLLARQR